MSNGAAVELFRVGAVSIWEADWAICFLAGMQIDLDGAPQAYHPPTPEHPHTGRPPGLDDLANASRNLDGKAPWAGIAVDARGAPYVQGTADPCPGFYVSTTALGDHNLAASDPRRYVDAMTVPYFSLPSRAVKRVGGLFTAAADIQLGDLGVAVYRGQVSGAIYADVGPAGRIGEGSPALATNLGCYRGPRAGHDAADIAYVVFRGSAAKPAWRRDVAELQATALQLYEAWGGPAKLGAIFPGR